MNSSHTHPQQDIQPNRPMRTQIASSNQRELAPNKTNTTAMGILTHTTQHMEVPILPCTSPPGAFAQMVSSTQNVLLIRPSQLGQKGPSKISSAGTGHGFTCAPRAVWAITTALARLRVDCTSSHSPGNTSAAEIMSKSFCHTAGRCSTSEPKQTILGLMWSLWSIQREFVLQAS